MTDAGNARTIDFTECAVRLAMYTLVAAVAITVSVFAVTIGGLRLALTGSIWLLTVAIAGLAGGVLLVFLTQRSAERQIADWARSRPPRRRNQAFVSYSTAAHPAEAEAIAHLIQQAGVRVVFKKAGQAMVLDAAAPGARGGLVPESLSFMMLLSASVPRTSDSSGHRDRVSSDSLSFAKLSHFFESIGFYQSAGLDALLHAEIAASDVVVSLSRTAPAARISTWKTLRDHADCFLALLMYRNGMTPMFWRSMGYAVAYGRQVRTHIPFSSIKTWRDWELETAKALDIPIVQVHIADADEQVRNPELRICRASQLDADFRERILPVVMEAARPDLELTSGALPSIARGVSLGVCGVAAWIGLIAGVVTVVLFLVIRAIVQAAGR